SDFYYDGLNRQVARVINGIATYSVWDGAERVAEYDASGNVLNRWIYAGGDLVRSPNPQQIYYYPDGLGSTSRIADASGNVLERYTYDVGGSPAFYAPGGTTNLGQSAYGVDMLFTGQKWYSQLGLYDLRHRAYLTSLGRFLQPDPIGFSGDRSNIYRYCGNNPVNCDDPSGLEPPVPPGNQPGPGAPGGPVAPLPADPGALPPDIPVGPAQAAAGIADVLNNFIFILQITGHLDDLQPFVIPLNGPLPPVEEPPAKKPPSEPNISPDPSTGGQPTGGGEGPTSSSNYSGQPSDHGGISLGSYIQVDLSTSNGIEQYNNFVEQNPNAMVVPGYTSDPSGGVPASPVGGGGWLKPKGQLPKKKH
ncbi:MAG: RHS repeat-associated core domain-containing protein, partial [Ktedonobacteraceae bacterium]|nr:RHS repeat-associated core domain-containing protein [Ktedonobacteraceae bacterium]